MTYGLGDWRVAVNATPRGGCNSVRRLLRQTQEKGYVSADKGAVRYLRDAAQHTPEVFIVNKTFTA